MRSLEDALKLFKAHAPTGATGDYHERHEAVDFFFQEAVERMWQLMPEGPGKTVALRKLQDACWSVHGCIANNGE